MAEARSEVLRAMLRDSITYTLPAVLSQGLGLILLPIYARVLARDEFGALDLVLAIAPIVTVIVTMELQQGLARLRADATADDMRRMTGTAWIASACGLLLFLAIGTAVADSLGEWVFGRVGFGGTVRLGVLSITSTAAYAVVTNQFRWELRSRAYAVVSTTYALVTLTLTVLLTLANQLGLQGVLLAQTFAAGSVTLVSLVLLRRSWRPVVDLGHLRRMLAFSLPLIPASLSVVLTLYFNRLALSFFGDLDDVASYGMAARLSGVVGLLIVGLQSAVTPLVYNHYRDPGTPRQLAHLFSGVAALSVALCVGVNVFAADVTVVLAGREYLSSAPLMALIAPALLIGQLYVFAPGMGIAMRTRAQLGVAASAALVDVLANVLLVPWWGALGAAVATVVSSCAFLGLWVRMSQKYYPVPFEGHRLTVAGLVFVGGSVVAVILRGAVEPLDTGGLVLKAFTVLGCLFLLFRAGLFEGVRSALRPRPSGPGETASTGASD